MRNSAWVVLLLALARPAFAKDSPPVTDAAAITVLGAGLPKASPIMLGELKALGPVEVKWLEHRHAHKVVGARLDQLVVASDKEPSRSNYSVRTLELLDVPALATHRPK